MGNNVHDFYGKICLFRGRVLHLGNPNYALSQSEKWFDFVALFNHLLAKIRYSCEFFSFFYRAMILKWEGNRKLIKDTPEKKQ